MLIILISYINRIPKSRIGGLCYEYPMLFGMAVEKFQMFFSQFKFTIVHLFSVNQSLLNRPHTNNTIMQLLYTHNVLFKHLQLSYCISSTHHSLVLHLCTYITNLLQRRKSETCQQVKANCLTLYYGVN